MPTSIDGFFLVYGRDGMKKRVWYLWGTRLFKFS